MKTLKILTTVLFALFLLCYTTACNADDEGPSKDKIVTAVSVKATYKLYVEKELLQYAGVDINYTKNGKIEKVTMSDENPVTENQRQYCVLEINWPNQRLPLKEIVTAKFSMKDGIPLPHKIGVSTAKFLEYTVTYSDGSTISGVSSKKFSEVTVKADKFEEYLQSLTYHFDTQEIEIEAEEDGTLDIDFED